MILLYSSVESLTSSGSPDHSQTAGELKYISKYLVQYAAATSKAKPAVSMQRVSGARVLTRTQCVAILKEREEQKKKEQEEKRKRKLEARERECHKEKS